MDTITAKILIFFLSIFILIVVSHQVKMMFGDSYKTETAMSYSSAEKVSFNGIYVRNEKVVTTSTDGVLSYPCTDGSKIAKGSVVAYVYASADDIVTNQKINRLNAEVAVLEKEQSPGTTDVAQPEFISGLIDEKYQTITSLIASGDLDTLESERMNFQSLLGIYQIVIKKENDYNDRIDSLKTEIARLEKTQRQSIASVTVDDSGYFMSHVDGYENILSTDNTGSITSDMINKIISNGGYNSAKVSKHAVGKLVDGYEWKMIGIINPEDADFRVGNKVSVKLSSTPDAVSAEIEEIRETDNPNENIIVISCQNLNYNLVQNRTERVELILNDYNGIKVPRNAIRFNKNNEKGVYILQGQKVAFKKLNVVYECDDYLLSAITSDPHYISAYDDVITSGEIPAEVMNIADEENEMLDDSEDNDEPLPSSETQITSQTDASDIAKTDISNETDAPSSDTSSPSE